jgi:23S rRNA (pseudouridine1915-N3)-methyltransferase
MKISVINTCDTSESYLKEGLTIYEKRLRHYFPFEMVYLTEPRNAGSKPMEVRKEIEGKIILKALVGVDQAVLLDKKGRHFSSVGFAKYIQKYLNKGIRNLGFIIGGPFGFSDEVYQSVPERVSLSEMTFPHQLVRLVFLEQLYRAFTIIKGEAYHYE